MSVDKLNILVTGGSGFIGKQLTSALINSDSYRIVSVVRKGGIEASNVTAYSVESIDSETDYSDLLCTHNISVVIHAAGRSHIMHEGAVDPLAEYRKVNVEGTINLARQAAEADVKRFIFLSSIKVNGESTSGRNPFTAFDIRRPEDPYGQSKSEAEAQLLALGKETGMEIVIIRPPLVYGEGVKANFASLIRLVGKSYPLPFGAIKNNKRSLVSVYNLVDLIKVCIDHPNAANQIFLASDDDDMSTARMVDLMAKVQGKMNILLPVPLWCFNLAGKFFKKELVVDRLIGSLQLDIEHTKKTLDWVPPYTVEHGFVLAAKRKD